MCCYLELPVVHQAVAVDRILPAPEDGEPDHQEGREDIPSVLLQAG